MAFPDNPHANDNQAITDLVNEAIALGYTPSAGVSAEALAASVLANLMRNLKASESLSVSGAVTATAFTGAATGLTSVPAGQLSGTLPDAVFPATLPASSAANLTSIPAAQVTGSLPSAALAGAYTGVTGVGSSAGLTVASGTPIKGVTLYTPALTPAAVAANTTAEQVFAVAGVQASDVLLAVIKPTAQAGLGIVGYRVPSAGNVAITFANNTAAAITPTAAEQYKIVALSV